MSTTASLAATPPPEAPPAQPADSGRTPWGFALLVIGALLVGIGIPLLASGAALAAAAATQRADGSVSSDFAPFSTAGYAITSQPATLQLGPMMPKIITETTLMLKARSTTGQAVFLGIGPTTEVDNYLSGVAHSVVDDVGMMSRDTRYRSVSGTEQPTPPGDETFWTAVDSGTGPVDIQIPLRSGQWTVVVMNADGTAPVSVDLSASVNSGAFAPISATLIILGIIAVLIGAALAVVAALILGRPLVTLAGSVRYGDTAAHMSGHADQQLSRGLWLVKWFLAIPHLVILAVLWIGLLCSTVVAFFAILVTGRYPRSLFAYAVGVLRWSWRVSFYAFAPLGTDEYPPFSLAPRAYPASFDVAYPEHLSRGLIFVKSWLLAIPHLIIVGIFTSTAIGSSNTGGGFGLQFSLLGILSLITGVILLVRGRYPHGLFTFVMGIQRWVYRVSTYVLLLRDEYPPFRLDQGGEEPAPQLPPEKTTQM